MRIFTRLLDRRQGRLGLGLTMLIAILFFGTVMVNGGWAQQSQPTVPAIVAAENSPAILPAPATLPALPAVLPALPAVLPAVQASQTPASPALTAAQVAEIKAIRAQIQGQMGGGVTEQLKGIAGFESVAGHFDAELRRVAGVGQSTQATVTSNRTQGAVPAVTKTVSATQPNPLPFGSALKATNPKVASLRSAARHLDAAAADLEDIGLYADADAMRARANRLRQEARK